MKPNADSTGVIFDVEHAPSKQEKGEGTISASGVTCPCCSVIIKREDLQQAGFQGQLGSVMTAVVVDGQNGKEYRRPKNDEIRLADEAEYELERVFSEVPFSFLEEPVPQGASRAGGGSPFTAHRYGLIYWQDIFTSRQLMALGIFVSHIRATGQLAKAQNYSSQWIEAIQAYLACAFDRLANHSTSLSRWYMGGEAVKGVFARFALPILWDFAEVNPLSPLTGAWVSAYEWVTLSLDYCLSATKQSHSPKIQLHSAISNSCGNYFDCIITDPPYYDAIPYSDLMDFFYIWLRRTLYSLSPEIDQAFSESLAPKWNHNENDGELIDDASRFDGDREKSKAVYEDGMARAFKACHQALKDDGRLVIVFANKQPDAWETLVTAIIKAGFVVDGSWPIQTEMGNRTRAIASGALSSSIWLVCKKRDPKTRPGWDNKVLTEMQQNIVKQLRAFWDAGIRGPDFVWAATGPAMEAFSRHPVVKKANEPGDTLRVGEFLGHVRRMVLDFVVGRILTQNGGTEVVSGLDDATTYYLLHRSDFGMEEAPSGACILYALSCNLTDRKLSDRYDLLQIKGSTVKLKSWKQRNRPNMGYDPALDSLIQQKRRQPALPGMPETTAAYAVPSREIPLIDQVHRLMHLWKEGSVNLVDDYLNMRGLRRNTLFHQLLQALIELARNDERATLESISNHIAARGVATEKIL